jgi:hypothetical protein
LVHLCCREGKGGLFDEAYEFYHERPESALQHIDDIDATDIFVIGAATKGLQVPGLRVGYTTVTEGEGPLVPGRGPVRTGVTALLPRGFDPEPIYEPAADTAPPTNDTPPESDQ